MTSNRPADTKVTPLVSTFVYHIATGQWEAGERLPSVRAAGETWGVDRRTVLAAYRVLEDRGLVRSEPRRGFFVAPGPQLGRLGRHRNELESLHETLRGRLEQTGLHPASALRWLARLEDAREAQHPRCAFVECTTTQAEGHAREVHARLGVPCLGISLSDLDGKAALAPDGVETLLISRFHTAELHAARKGPKVLAVSIEAAPDLASRLPRRGARAALVLETDSSEAENLLRDVQGLELPFPTEAHVVEDTEAEVARLLREKRLLLCSPRLYGALTPEIRRHERLHELAFRIANTAWPSIADALGLPLGSADSQSE